MLLTYLLSPATTNSSRSAISCYWHTYCRQLQQIRHVLLYHVTEIPTVTSYNKFVTFCYIMLTYLLSPTKTNSSRSAILCYWHTYCCQLQQIRHVLLYHVIDKPTVTSNNKFVTFCYTMLLTYLLSPTKTNSSRSAISSYWHTYCRQLQQIRHVLLYHVIDIPTVAN